MSYRLFLDKFEGADLKYDNSLLKFQPKNNQIRHFWFQIQAFLFFRKILQLDKFEGADFKYDNIVFTFQPKIRKSGIFVFFREILQIDKFEGADFNYDNSSSNILAPKYPNTAFLVKIPQ